MAVAGPDGGHAAAAARQAVAPLVDTFRRTGGLPDGFWDDAYVFGYMGGTAAMAARLAAGGSLDEETLGEVVLSVLEECAGRDRDWLAGRAEALHGAADAAFAEGRRNAEKVMTVAMGGRQFDKDPDVRAARDLVQRMRAMKLLQKNAEPRADVAACLQTLLLFDRVRHSGDER
ncbi:MAG: hypothetical protein RIE31_06530 [Alphaproteobacteria bacterium]